MERFPQSTSYVSDELNGAFPTLQEGDVEEAEPHIHMPNPSYWPLLLSVAVVIAVGALLFVFTAPWILLIVFPLVLIAMLGWGLEDPFAPLKEKFDFYPAAVDQWKFKIGQNVVDKRGNWLGKVRARFSRYILVERGRLLPKVYYVPQSVIRDQIKNNTIFLTLSEDELVSMGLTRIPEDLYDEVPEAGVPVVRGRPQFAKRPLSPAETGHYNYGRRSPGINTDASGSYHRGEVSPTPQTYVTEDIYSTDEDIPVRTISPD